MGLNVKKINIRDIKPASYNPRQIDDSTKERLRKSIEEFGLVDPIIINLKTKNIIGGHQRFDYLYHLNNDITLHLLELGDIGWVFTDTDLEIKDDKHEKALNLALNRISGEWNIDALNNILDELKEFDLHTLTGFDYALDDFDYEFVPLDEDFTISDDFPDVSDESEQPTSEDIIIEDETAEVTENIVVENNHQNNKKSVPKNTIYRNNNNIIYYGEETDDNLKRLFQQKASEKNYNITGLKHLKSIPVETNYYITNSEDIIKLILQDTDTERVG